jgi:hypothetical protein
VSIDHYHYFPKEYLKSHSKKKNSKSKEKLIAKAIKEDDGN